MGDGLEQLKAVCTRLAPAFPGIAAHVGEDYRAAAIAGWNDPRPALGQVGVHWTPAVARDIEPLVDGVDWRAAVDTAGERVESPAVGEIQQRDLARAVDPMDLAGEAARFAERAARYYAVVVRSWTRGDAADGPARDTRAARSVQEG